jgi:predicted HAD superfamily phosphohydrolase
MKSLVVLVLFIGLFMITHGVYEQKLKSISEKEKIVYKFIPRTLYEEQLGNNTVTSKLNSMFNE